MADMDPRKLKVNELKEQLQLVGLPTTGKKEELVARLLEHQKQDGADDAGVVAPPTGTGDNFDWENEEVALPPSDSNTAEKRSGDVATTSSGTPATALADGAAAPVTTATTSSTSGTTTAAAVTTPAPEETATAAAAGSSGAKTPQQEALLAEYEKRKNRAARFGIPLTEQDKALERAARFGIPVKASKDTGLSGKPTAATSTAAAVIAPSASTVRSSGKADPIKNIQVSQDVLNKRAERFGIQPKAANTTPTASTPTSTAGNKSSLYKLDDAEEEKKRKRAAKFGAPATDDASKKVKV